MGQTSRDLKLITHTCPLGSTLACLLRIIEVQLPSPEAARRVPGDNQAVIGEATPWHRALARPPRGLLTGALRLSQVFEPLHGWIRLAKPQLVPKHLPFLSCGRACSRPSRPRVRHRLSRARGFPWTARA